jgi:hypothetical protein
MDMNLLEREPSENERILLEVVCESRARWDTWPIFQYFEALLYQRQPTIDAHSILLESPRIPIGPAGIGHYGWFRLSNTNLSAPKPGDTLALTIAGMRHLRTAQTDVDFFLEILRYLVAREREFTPSPTEVQAIEVAFGELLHDLQYAEPRRRFLTPDRMIGPADFLRTEPSTWSCPIATPDSGDPTTWTITLSPFLRRYNGVTNASEYIERLIEQLAPHPPPATSSCAALALPEAIDYLNAVWRLHAGTPLLRITRAEAAARLALSCSVVEEFEANLSALCGILGQLQLPGQAKESKLFDLKEYLRTRLDTDGFSRAEGAVDDLRRLFDLRAWRQHPGADDRGRRAMMALGLQLPAARWGDAWSVVRVVSVNALNAIREETEGLL